MDRTEGAPPAVSVFLPVAGHADTVGHRFAGDPGAWLPRSRSLGPGRWQVRLHTPGMPTLVEIEVGHCPPGTRTATVWRSFSWRVVVDGVADEHRPILPWLTGEVGLYTRGDHASLVLTGSCDPGGDLRTAHRAAVCFLEAVGRSLAQVPAAA